MKTHTDIANNNLKALVGITALIGGVSTGIVTLVVLFAPGHLWAATGIVTALSAMGSIFGILLQKR